MSNIIQRDPKTDPPPKDGTMFIADICLQKTCCCMWCDVVNDFVSYDHINGISSLETVQEIFWWCEMPVVGYGPGDTVKFPCELTGEDKFRYEQQKKAGEA